MLQVMLMTILHAHTENFQIRSWKNLDVHREIYLNGFLITQKKTNPKQCYSFSSHDINTEISVGSFNIKNTHSQKLLDVTIDCKLTFHDISNLCKKVSAKISSMARVLSLMLLNQKGLITSHFNVLI